MDAPFGWMGAFCRLPTFVVQVFRVEVRCDEIALLCCVSFHNTEPHLRETGAAVFVSRHHLNGDPDLPSQLRMP